MSDLCSTSVLLFLSLHFLDVCMCIHVHVGCRCGVAVGVDAYDKLPRTWFCLTRLPPAAGVGCYSKG